MNLPAPRASSTWQSRVWLRGLLRPRLLRALLALALWLGLTLQPARAGEPFVAFSLREAAQQLRSAKPGSGSSETGRLAGITRIAGMVHDPANQDIILVGQAHPADQPLALDEFVVALRALVVHKQWPLVSIDETADSSTTRLQAVRFEGGIAQSSFGKALYEADVLLKDLVLGNRSATVWGVKSYLKLSEDDIQRRGARGLSSVRFWYVTDDSRMTSRGNVFALDELRIALRTQAQSSSPVALPAARGPAPQDAGERFAHDFSARFDDLAVAYRPIARLRQLFAMTALARGVQSLASPPNLDFWLKEYAVARVETAKQHPLITTSVSVRSSEKIIDLNISGGVQLTAAVRRLKDGDVSALEEAVMQARPSQRALFWRVPLDGWRLAGYPDADRGDAGAPAAPAAVAGTTVTRAIGAVPSGTTQDFMRSTPAMFTPSAMPGFEKSPSLTRQLETSRIGGVMLGGEATVVEAGKAQSRAGAFSILASGEGAGLSAAAHRHFVTALWAVYYSDQDPGISIDPIARGVDRQLVRYIGRVINTDLGRVMREADYTMKKWAVGTERPEIAGFKDVDTLAGKQGMTLSDAFRRFWFVPEGMTFKATDTALVFDSGRMRLKTQSNIFGQRTEPIESDERFARFFTNHYAEIAGKYPIFDELFEYAKLVSLAKYLKNKGVPLQWFLLANHDQVITELSSGSVETLSKGSQFADAIRIEGGVDLAGRYVLDQSAAAALRKSIASGSRSKASGGGTALPPSELAPSSFSHGRSAYSVIPQHSMAGGKDRNGTRYQTDISVRDGNRPGLELIRYFQPNSAGDRVGAEMGNGWRLLIPFRAYPIGPSNQPFNIGQVPEKWRIRNQLTGRDEVLTLDTQVYAQAGYRPQDMQKSQFVGMFWTLDWRLRLADKFGNEFWFDGAGLLHEMHFSNDFGVRFEYDHADVPAASKAAPFHLAAHGKESAAGFTVKLPQRLRLTDTGTGKTEVFALGDRNGRAAYLPEAGPQASLRWISLLTDGSHVLIDQAGNETWFTLQLDFVKQRTRVVKAMAQGRYELNPQRTDVSFVARHRVRFSHEYDGQEFRVVRAELFKHGSPDAVRTIVYEYGTDRMLASVVGVRDR